MPAVLIAAATVITAAASLVAVHHQGPPGHGGRETIEVARPPAGGRPWSEAVAVIVARDGSEVRVRAPTFSNCMSQNHQLRLADGQRVSFERMRSFSVLQADSRDALRPRAEVAIVLLDGTRIEGSTPAHCPLFGDHDRGRHTTYFQDLQRVDFAR